MADPANPGTQPQGKTLWGLIRVGGNSSQFSFPREQMSLADSLAQGVGKAHNGVQYVHFDMRNYARTLGTPSGRKLPCFGYAITTRSFTLTSSRAASDGVSAR